MVISWDKVQSKINIKEWLNILKVSYDKLAFLMVVEMLLWNEKQNKKHIVLYKLLVGNYINSSLSIQRFVLFKYVY